MKALSDSNINSFSKKAESLVIEGSGWESKVAGHKSDLYAHITFLVNTSKEKLLEKLRQTTQKANEQRVKDIIHDQVSNLGEHLAK